MPYDLSTGTNAGNNRILKAVDGDIKLANDITKALRNGEVERVLSKVDNDVNVITYKLDADGKITGIWP
jgi:hypothetical protein